jgi:hypothetical protein
MITDGSGGSGDERAPQSCVDGADPEPGPVALPDPSGKRRVADYLKVMNSAEVQTLASSTCRAKK